MQCETQKHVPSINSTTGDGKMESERRNGWWGLELTIGTREEEKRSAAASVRSAAHGEARPMFHVLGRSVGLEAAEGRKRNQRPVQTNPHRSQIGFAGLDSPAAAASIV